jgi:hypothetical protein
MSFIGESGELILRGELDLLGISLPDESWGVSCFYFGKVGDSFPSSNFFNLEDEGDLRNLA